MDSGLHSALTEHISILTGTPAINAPLEPLGGGCINRAYRLGDWFIKCNHSDLLDMFATETLALNEINQYQLIRAPQPLWHGLVAGQACLIMEYIPLQPLKGKAEERLGQQLAALHQHQQAYFGWQCDNTLGRTLQPNKPDNDWVNFWRTQRLEHQLRLAAEQGYGGRLQELGERLLLALEALLAGHTPQPALLHGDLWSGNAAMTADQQPVIFDPACYYGDRETDIAMTELFGGFSQRFYSAYHEVYPLDDGAPLRFTVYNIYHVLNHLNLFGGSYAQQAERLMESLLSMTR